MTTTVREIIKSSLTKINAIQPGETPTDSDLDISLESLEGLIDSWSNEKLMIYTFNPFYFEATAGNQIYTLGPGGDWDTPRPMNIQQAYLSLNAQINNTNPVTFSFPDNVADLPIAIANDSQWASIAIKQLTAVFPTILYDDGNYPLRNIYLYPIPNQNQVITLWLWQPLDNFDSLDDVIEFPPGYERCIIYNLAMELAPEFGKVLTEEVISVATDSKMILAAINSDPQIMAHDRSLGTTGTQYNWIYGTQIPIPGR
jgi:hypothetical protein